MTTSDACPQCGRPMNDDGTTGRHLLCPWCENPHVIISNYHPERLALPPVPTCPLSREGVAIVRPVEPIGKARKRATQ